MRTRALLAACLSFGLFACDIPTGNGSDGGADGAASPTSTSDGGASASGVDCAQVASGVALCTGISVCGSVAVDHDVYPDCGFRIHGDVLDLECVCNGDSVCPIGVATDCASAAQLLQNQTEQTVCQQVAEDRCTSIGGGGTGGTTGGSTSTCDKTCESECAGNPSCMQQCGC